MKRPDCPVRGGQSGLFQQFCLLANERQVSLFSAAPQSADSDLNKSSGGGGAEPRVFVCLRLLWPGGVGVRVRI